MNATRTATEALASTLNRNTGKLSNRQFLARLNALTIKFNRKFGEPAKFGHGAKPANKKGDKK